MTIENGLPDRLIQPIAEWIAELREAQSLVFEATGFFGNMPLVRTTDTGIVTATPGSEYDLGVLAPLPGAACWLMVEGYINNQTGQWWRVRVWWSAGSAVRCQEFDENGLPTCEAWSVGPDEVEALP